MNTDEAHYVAFSFQECHVLHVQRLYNHRFLASLMNFKDPFGPEPAVTPCICSILLTF